MLRSLYAEKELEVHEVCGRIVPYSRRESDSGSLPFVLASVIIAAEGLT